MGDISSLNLLASMADKKSYPRCCVPGVYNIDRLKQFAEMFVSDRKYLFEKDISSADRDLRSAEARCWENIDESMDIPTRLMYNMVKIYVTEDCKGMFWPILVYKRELKTMWKYEFITENMEGAYNSFIYIKDAKNCNDDWVKQCFGMTYGQDELQFLEYRTAHYEESFSI